MTLSPLIWNSRRDSYEDGNHYKAITGDNDEENLVTHQPRRCNPTVAWWLHVSWLEVALQDPKVGETDGQSHPVCAHRETEPPRRLASSCPAEDIINPGRRGCDLIPRVLGKHKTWKETVARPSRLIAMGSTLARRTLSAFLALQREREHGGRRK